MSESDDLKVIRLMADAFDAAERGAIEEAIRLHDAILRLDVSAYDKVLAHLFKSYHLIQLDRTEEAADETEFALKLDSHIRTGVFDDPAHRAMVFGNLDCEWLDQLKSFGRADEWVDGIEYAEEKLQLLSHIPGTYMPLTRFWIARKLALMDQRRRAVTQFQAGLAAEVVENDHYKALVQSRASSVTEALRTSER